MRRIANSNTTGIPISAPANQLTPQLAQMIKAELNELKSTMEVHESSRCYTQFF